MDPDAYKKDRVQVSILGGAGPNCSL